MKCICMHCDAPRDVVPARRSPETRPVQGWSWPGVLP